MGTNNSLFVVNIPGAPSLNKGKLPWHVIYTYGAQRTEPKGLFWDRLLNVSET